ncbi:MAG: DUF2336 domain-containing protein [Rhodospirillales bacterium]
MSEKFGHLESLARLAKEGSPDKRRDLLREVTDLFLEAPEELSEREKDHFAAIIGKVAFELEMKVREHLAEQLSTIDAAPHRLVSMLANDEIEVARPILINSNVLQNADLLEMVKRHSQEHLLAISLRQKVDGEVAGSLVERGDDKVLASLARNKGAVIPRNSMEIMVARSRHNEALHEPLATRHDLPPDLMHEMFWFVSSALREHILSSTADLGEDQVDEMLEETRSRLDAEDQEELLSPAEKFVLRKERLNQLNVRLLAALVRQGRIPEFVAAIARLAKIDLTMARRIVFDKSGEMLAVVGKAIGIDQVTFSNLVLLTDVDGTRSENARIALLGVYNRIKIESAQRALRFWRTRKQAMKHVANGQITSAERDKKVTGD